MPNTKILRKFTTLCPPCANRHYDGQCYALLDDDNSCQCECDSTIPNLESMDAAAVSGYRRRVAARGAA